MEVTEGYGRSEGVQGQGKRDGRKACLKHPTQSIVVDGSELRPDRIEVEQVDGVAGAFVVHGLLSDSLCHQYISMSEELGYERKISSRSGPPIRDNERCLMEATPEMCRVLADRLRQTLCEPFFSVEGRSDGRESNNVKGTSRTSGSKLTMMDLVGSSVGQDWVAKEDHTFVNCRWRMNKYSRGQQFWPHYDSGFEFSELERSLMSLVVYLNDDFASAGGGTCFYPSPKNKGDSSSPSPHHPVTVSPRKGTGLVFFHYGPLSPFHAGLPHVEEGRSKYIIRTDLVFERPASSLLSRRHVMLLLGPPCSGKGTQLRKARERHPKTVVAVDFGQCVRTAVRRGTPEGNEITAFRQARSAKYERESGKKDDGERKKGGWLPDDLCERVFLQGVEVAESQSGVDADGGGVNDGSCGELSSEQGSRRSKVYLFDGYPRKRCQSLFLEKSGWNLLKGVELKLGEDDLCQRIEGRLIHAQSGRTYHTALRPPSNRDGDNGNWLDDVTGEALVRRPEDTQQSLSARMMDWNEDTLPFCEHLGKRKQLDQVDAAMGVEEVADVISFVIASHVVKEGVLPPTIRDGIGDRHCDGINRSTRKHALLFFFHANQTNEHTNSSYSGDGKVTGDTLALKVCVEGRGAVALSEERKAMEELGQVTPNTTTQHTIDYPQSIAYAIYDGFEFHLSRCVAGVTAKDLCRNIKDDSKETFLSAIAQSLALLHLRPVQPFTDMSVKRASLKMLLERAVQRQSQGLVPARNFQPKYTSNSNASSTLDPSSEIEILKQLSLESDDHDMVVLHGDFCLPNIVMDESSSLPRVRGLIDVGGLSVGDRYWDLALSKWSVGHNLGPEASGRFLELYFHQLSEIGGVGSIAPACDYNKLAYVQRLCRFLV